MIDEGKPEPKVVTVKTWMVTLKSGHTAEFSVREDLGDSHTTGLIDNRRILVWNFPRIKKESRVVADEVAACDYQELEIKELNTYIPKVKKFEELRRKRGQAKGFKKQAEADREPDLT